MRLTSRLETFVTWTTYVVCVLALGCGLTDYPVITDTRGDFSGVIRTGHKAFIQPIFVYSVATIWDDGTDELFNMVYQNSYGDQVLYTFNNFDPTASVIFLDNTYCDWRYEGCETLRAWNPHQDNVDEMFDYEFFSDCSGARDISILTGTSSRMGECGDGVFLGGRQDLATEFSQLATTTWRGKPAYIVPVSAQTASLSIGGFDVPLYGQSTGLITDSMQLIFPMTPNSRHTLRWLSEWAEQHPGPTEATLTYGSFSTSVPIKLRKPGIDYNISRF